ncbi:MAG: hypothetical protein ACRC46_06845 [Thermoguttaceae bacterium]
MAVFKSTRMFSANPSLIPLIATDLMMAFQAEGFEVKKDELLAGNAEVSITKGGMFKAVLGLKTALRVSLRGDGTQHIVAEAGVGIFGQQAIPTVISMLFFWPVLITQIWGIYDRAIWITVQ